jgi:hypothetical protein
MSDNGIKIIAAKVSPYQTQSNNVYVSSTNESNGVGQVHINPVGGKDFSNNRPANNNLNNL